MIGIKFSPDVAPFLFQLTNNFMKYKLENIRYFTNKYGCGYNLMLTNNLL